MSSPERGSADMPDSSDIPMTGAEKANFIKAMLEGVKKPASDAADRPHVEVLRRIPAPEPPVARATPESEDALRLAAVLDAKVAAGELEALTPEALQALTAALCRFYGANVQAGIEPPILSGRDAATGTDVMNMCGALLEGVGLQVFELGMWLSWQGR